MQELTIVGRDVMMVRVLGNIYWEGDIEKVVKIDEILLW